MIDLIAPYIPRVGTALVIAGFIVAIFRYLNRTVHGTIKESVSYWLLGEIPKLNLMQQAAALILRIFGARHFSWRCIFMSIAITVVVNSALFLWINVELAHVKTGLYSPWQDVSDPGVWVVLLYAVAFTGLVPDYLSLGKARWLLSRAAGAKSFWAKIGWIFLDILTSAVLITLALKIFQHHYQSLDNFGKVFRFLNDGVADNFFVGPTYFIPIWLSGFVPSIWVLIYFSAVIFTRMAILATKTVAFLTRWVSNERIDKDPLALVGEMAGAIVFVLICISGML